MVTHSLPNDDVAIHMQRLVRTFGKTYAVADVDWEIRRGSICGFIGPNGAGKTTTMRILATLDLPTSGDAKIHGLSVVQDADRVRRLIGFMPDQYGKYSNLTCEEYLDFFARAYGLAGEERRRRVGEVMAFTGVAAIRSKTMTALSKGMLQRLCLGRALIHDPAILIMDEPAAGLDPRARRELRDMCLALAERDKTLLISSHVLAELSEFVDQVAIIERGRLVAQGTVAEIQTQAKIAPRIHLRVRGRVNDCCQWIQQHFAVEEVEVAEGAISFACSDARQDEGAGLLRSVVTAGFEVVEFRTHTQSLEDVFLRLTQGDVQ